MRVPSNISQTLNAFLAFRAILRVVNRFNEQHPNAIRQVVYPGLGTGTGEMPPMICAKQMHAAYLKVTEGKDHPPASINEALLEHYRLLRVDD